MLCGNCGIACLMLLFILGTYWICVESLFLRNMLGCICFLFLFSYGEKEWEGETSGWHPFLGMTIVAITAEELEFKRPAQAGDP